MIFLWIGSYSLTPCLFLSPHFDNPNENERKCKRDYSKLLRLLQFALKCRKRKSNKTCRPSLLLTYRDIYARQGGIRYDDYFFFFSVFVQFAHVHRMTSRMKYLYILLRYDKHRRYHALSLSRKCL